MKAISLCAGGVKKFLFVFLILTCVGFAFGQYMSYDYDDEYYDYGPKTGDVYNGLGVEEWRDNNMYVVQDGGRTYLYLDKTSLVYVGETTIKGSGNSGAFISGRTVELSPYVIGKYLVTQELYQTVMNESPFDGKTATLTKGENQIFRPAESINLFQIATFCNLLSEMHGLEPAFTIDGTKITCDITKSGWRIPTEAEWECAARGGDPSNTSAWNNIYAGAKDTKDLLNYAWISNNSNDETHEVGLKKPNSLGLYDVLGNVYEWCLDINGTISKENVTNPTGAASGTDRVQRGSAIDFGTSTTVLSRYYDPQDTIYGDLGFRLCRTYDEKYTTPEYKPVEYFGEFGDIELDGKTLEKTSFIGVTASTVNGLGSKGVYITGRTVNLGGYIMGKYPVTQELYEKVVRKIPYAKYPTPSKGKSDTLTKGETQGLRPVECVDFFEVAEFCNKLSELQGLEPVFTIKGDTVTADITKNGWRVPTEAEWEYAARGGYTGDMNRWNSFYAGAEDEKDLLNYAWLKENSGGNTHEVGLKEPNILGFYDMLGNVYEWCLDINENITTGSVKNPTGAATGTERVQRGSSKGSSSAITVLTRDKGEQTKYWNDVGFRLCRTSNIAEETKDLSLSVTSLYGRNEPRPRSIWDEGDGSGDIHATGNLSSLSGNVLTIYVPMTITEPEYYVRMKSDHDGVIKAASIENVINGNGDIGAYARFSGYYWTDYESVASFSWNFKDDDKFEFIFEDGSSKTYTVKVKQCSVAYTTWNDMEAYCIPFWYKDVDPNYELKASDIVFPINDAGAVVDKLVKKNTDEKKGSLYEIYVKIKNGGDISFAVEKKDGSIVAMAANYDSGDEPFGLRYLSDNLPYFGDIVIDGKTYQKTGSVEIPETVVYGSGDTGVFIADRHVSFNPYMIGQYPVTQELYEAVVRKIPNAKYPTPSKGKSDTLTKGETQGLRPVECVDFFEVAEFCNKLSELQGLEPVFTITGDTVTFDITKNGWRVPTEAEWEYAARGRTAEDGTKDLYAGASDVNDVLNYAWVKANSNGVTHEVGLKKPNENALYDMLGNVYEWCIDLYGSLEKDWFTNPTGATSGTERVQRGSSKGSASSITTTTRDKGEQTKYWNDVGFRLCRTLPQPK